MYSHHLAPTQTPKSVPLKLIHRITDVTSKENLGVSNCPFFCNLVNYGGSLNFSLNSFVPIHFQELVALHCPCIAGGCIQFSQSIASGSVETV